MLSLCNTFNILGYKDEGEKEAVLDETEDQGDPALLSKQQQRSWVLILDVASHRFPPHWIRFAHLISLMSKTDGTSKMPRGYLHIQRDSYFQ